MPTVITARSFGPRPLTEIETMEIFQKQMVEAMYEESRASIEAWKRMARSSRRTGNYIRSIDVITFNYAPKSVQIEIGSTLKYAKFLEGGRRAMIPKGQSFGTANSPRAGAAKYPWPDRKGGGTRGQVYASSVGPAAPRRFRDRVLLQQQPELRRRIAVSARKIREQVITEMNAKAIRP